MKNKRGVTLLELTMMIALGSILIIGISRGAQAQIKNTVDMRNYMIALNLAKKQMAIMNNGAYPAVGTTAPAADAAFPNFTYSQVVSSVATSGVYSIRQIQLDVLNGTRVLVRLYTYRSDLITFGNGS
jgi:hypothetical protein